MFNFLAILDIRVFGRLHLWLLIGLTLFLQPPDTIYYYRETLTSLNLANPDLEHFDKLKL